MVNDNLNGSGMETAAATMYNRKEGIKTYEKQLRAKQRKSSTKNMTMQQIQTQRVKEQLYGPPQKMERIGKKYGKDHPAFVSVSNKILQNVKGPAVIKDSSFQTDCSSDLLGPKILKPTWAKEETQDLPRKFTTFHNRNGALQMVNDNLNGSGMETAAATMYNRKEGKIDSCGNQKRWVLNGSSYLTFWNTVPLDSKPHTRPFQSNKMS